LNPFFRGERRFVGACFDAREDGRREVVWEDKPASSLATRARFPDT
jgi:hypothetical protein